MHAASILYPTGNVRLSTIIVFAVFVMLSIVWHRWEPFVACLVWLFSYELLLDVSLIALGRPATLDAIHLAIYSAITVAGPVWLWRQRIRPNWLLVAAGAVLWAVWMAAGFHVNEHTMIDFSPGAEVLNELTKTLWAFAYLLPLVAAHHGRVSWAAARPLERVSPDQRTVSSGSGSELAP